MSRFLVKLTGITAIIISSLYIFVFILSNIFIPYIFIDNHMIGYILFTLFTLLSLATLTGGINFLHYDDLTLEELKEKKKSILIWSVIFMMNFLLCGFLGLVAYLSLLDKKMHIKNDYIKELMELNDLKEKGIINEEDYKSMKKKILNI